MYLQTTELLTTEIVKKKFCKTAFAMQRKERTKSMLQSAPSDAKTHIPLRSGRRG